MAAGHELDASLPIGKWTMSRKKRQTNGDRQHDAVAQMLAEAAPKKDRTEFEISLTRGDLYRFNLYNTFTTSSGIIALVVAALVAAVAFFTRGTIPMIYTVIYIVCAIIFVLYYPILLFFQSKTEVERNVVLSHPLYVTIDADGVTIVSNAVEQGREVDLTWDDILLAKETKDELFLFTEKSKAYILPKRVIAKKLTKVKKFLTGGLPPEALALKKD